MEATLGLTGPFTYGRGWSRLVRLPNPAAGAVASHAVPGDRTQRLIFARASLKASAQEVTRRPRLVVKDADNNVVGVFGPSGAVLKSTEQATTYAVGLGSATAAASGDAQVAIPDMMLRSGMQVVLDVAEIQTEDQLSAVAFYLEEWPNGPDGYPQGVEPTYLPPGLLS